MTDSTLYADTDSGTTVALNCRGEWVPAIPLPYLRLGRKVCSCRRGFWTLTGYRGHYALAHILHLED